MQLATLSTPLRAAVFGSRFPAGRGVTVAASGCPRGTRTASSMPAPAPAPAPAPPCFRKMFRSWMVSRHSYQQQRAPISTKATRFSVVPRHNAASSTALRLRSHSLSGARMISSSPSFTSASEGEQQKSSSVASAALLDWNTFFTLRASRRRYTLISSIVAAIGTTSSGVTILATQDLETIGAQLMGLDPIVVMVLGTASCGAAGWLMGPFLGNSVWRLIHRKYRDAFAIKDKEFYDRIKRFRVDPSAQSFSNPVPDYYGEKIGSVQGYRRWLKDQRAYNRKKRSFV